MPFYFIKNFDEKRPCQDSQIPETILRLLPGDYVGNDACNAVVYALDWEFNYSKALSLKEKSNNRIP